MAFNINVCYPCPNVSGLYIAISFRKPVFWPCRVLLRESLCESTREAAWQSQKIQTHMHPYTHTTPLTSNYYSYVIAARQFCVNYLFQKNDFPARSSAIAQYTRGCLAGLGNYYTISNGQPLKQLILSMCNN